MELIEQATMTDEDRNACMWDQDGWGLKSEQVARALAIAARDKALRAERVAVVAFIRTLQEADRWLRPEGVARKVEAFLDSAGIKGCND